MAILFLQIARHSSIAPGCLVMGMGALYIIVTAYAYIHLMQPKHLQVLTGTLSDIFILPTFTP